MSKYQIAKKHMQTIVFVVAHMESGDYDYTECGGVEEAINDLLSEWWTPFDDISREEALRQCQDVIRSYDYEEVLNAIKKGFTWPIDLGFVVEIEGDE